MTTKVYILTYNDWEDTETIGVFSTKEYAEIARSIFNLGYIKHISIEEYELDVPPDVNYIQGRHVV